MHRFITILIIAACALQLRAQNAIEDYDSLSQLSSVVLMDQGRIYFEQRVPGKALACFSIVAERYKGHRRSEEAEECIRALNNSGCVYKYYYFDYVQAYSHLIRAYDLCEELGYDELLPLVLLNLGDLFNDYGDTYDSQSLSQQATDIFNQCIDKAFESKNWELLTTAFFNLSNQNHTLDLSKYENIFSPEIPDSTPDLAYIRLQYEGIRHIQQGEYAKARNYFELQLPVVSAPWAAERDTLSSYMNIARTYALENNHAQEAHYLLQALEISIANSDDDLSAKICKQLAKCYELLGNQDLQQQYRLLYLEKMEARQHSHLANIGELSYINELHKEEQRARELAEVRQFQQRLLLTAAIVLIVVVISVILLWRKNRELQARNQSLYEKYQQTLKLDTDENKYSHSNLNDSQKEALTSRIEKILNDAEAICQQDFNLSNLAKLADSNTTYISQVINERYGMTFSNVLSKYRIREACRRISDEREQYANITIEGIASSVGFKSRTAFINAFKREVGLTPSEYIRMAANEG